MREPDGFIRENGYDWRAFNCDECGELTQGRNMTDGVCPDCTDSRFDKPDEELEVECYVCGEERELSVMDEVHLSNGHPQTVCPECEVESDDDGPSKPTA